MLYQIMLILEILDKNSHDRKSFDCGNLELNKYIKEYARQDIDNGITQVYVLTEEEDVEALKKIYGYFTLNAFLLLTTEISSHTKKIPAKYQNIPAILIGRLAKDLHQTLLKGSEILHTALWKAKAISRELGAAYVVVHAIDSTAAKFYQKNGFVKIPSKENSYIFPLNSVN